MGFHITRYKPQIARYTMLSHKKETPNPDRYIHLITLFINSIIHLALSYFNIYRYKTLYRSKFRIKTDGINSLSYERLDLIYKKLFTWVLVDLKPPN